MYAYGYIIQLHYTAETNNTVKQSYYLKIFWGKIYVNRKFVIKKKKKKIPTSESFLEKFTVLQMTFSLNRRLLLSLKLHVL